MDCKNICPKTRYTLHLHQLLFYSFTTIKPPINYTNYTYTLIYIIVIIIKEGEISQKTHMLGLVLIDLEVII